MIKKRTKRTLRMIFKVLLKTFHFVALKQIMFKNLMCRLLNLF